MTNQKQELEEEEPKVNCIWNMHEKNSELILQFDMDTTQNYLIQNAICMNLSIKKVKQDLLTILLTKNKKVITKSTNNVNVTKLRNREILDKVEKKHAKKQLDSHDITKKYANIPKPIAKSSLAQKAYPQPISQAKPL